MKTEKFNLKSYTNFDFKNNWNLIKPYLNNKKVIKSIERAIIGYTHNKTPWPDSELYEIKIFYDYFEVKNKYVANYSSDDCFITYLEELEEEMIDEYNLDIEHLFLL